MKAFSQKEITLKKEYTALSNETTHFENSFKYRFLTASSIIGAIADGPYLYAGVLLLGTLPTPLMIVTATILTFLFIALIFSRYNDCQEKKQEFKQKKLETTLAWQRQELQKAIALYQTFLFSHKNADNELIQQQIVSLHLRELYTDFLATDDELKKLIAPSYKQAVLGGVKDGLYFFGALSSIYFAVGLFLFLSATAFPPAMVVAAAFISVVAMTGFIIKRVHQTKKDKKNFRHYLIHEKQKHDQEREEQFLDYILDCNDDGLTKGQFYFQESFEVVRSIGSGPYKSNNLTDFMLSTLKEKEPDGNSKDSHFMLLFWGGVSILYGLCLAIRAYGQGFSKIVKADKAKLSHATDETALSSKKEDEIEEKDLPSPPKPQLHRSKSFSSHARFFKSEKSLGNTGPAPQSTDKDTTPSSPEFPLKRATSQASIFQKQSRFFKSDQSAAEPHHEFTEPLPKTTSLVA
jgi:membrane protein implicated in regulation of membrane protease activity